MSNLIPDLQKIVDSYSPESLIDMYLVCLALSSTRVEYFSDHRKINEDFVKGKFRHQCIRCNKVTEEYHYYTEAYAVNEPDSDEEQDYQDNVEHGLNKYFPEHLSKFLMKEPKYLKDFDRKVSEDKMNENFWELVNTRTITDVKVKEIVIEVNKLDKDKVTNTTYLKVNCLNKEIGITANDIVTSIENFAKTIYSILPLADGAFQWIQFHFDMYHVPKSFDKGTLTLSLYITREELH
jgi:hypothetical protein